MHHTHSSAEAHSTAATTAASATAATATTVSTLESAFGQRLVLLAGRVTNGLIDGKNSASGLACGREYIQAHDLRLPNELIEHVVDSAFEHVDSLPEAILVVLYVNLPQSVKDVGRVHTRVVGELAWNNF